MEVLLYLIPLALLLGLLGLAGFIWSVKNNQYDDLEGAAHRILFEQDDDDEGSENELPTKNDSPNDDSMKQGDADKQ